MKGMLSLAIAAAMLLASSNAVQAATRAPHISLRPLTVGAVVSRPSACQAAAAIDGTPYFEMPTIAAEEGASGTTEVQIDLTSAGNLANAALRASSGNEWLDLAALRSAHLTHFSAEMRNCERVAGSYLYVVEF